MKSLVSEENTKGIVEEYNELSSNRKIYLEYARIACRLTIPTLLTIPLNISLP